MSRTMYPKNKHQISLSPTRWIGCIISTLTTFVIGNPVSAEQMEHVNVTISPSNPIEVWMPDRALHPGEGVTFHVDVEQDETHNGKEYTLDGDIEVQMIGPDSLWTLDHENANYYCVFKAVNTAQGALSDTAEVFATWKTTPPGGGGNGPPPESDEIHGYASGFIYSEMPVFVWDYPDKRMQFSDGESKIDFNVAASIGGAAIDMSSYVVQGSQEWIVDFQHVGNYKIFGNVSSDHAGKGKLKIYLSEENGSPVLLNSNNKEIAFSDHDLMIVTHNGGSQNLANDELNQPAPHDMNPGCFIIAPFGGGDIKRARITLKRDTSNPNSGIYSLNIEGTESIAIYNKQNGGQAINLSEKTWTGADIGNGLILFAGPSLTYNVDDGPLDGIITLDYKQSLGDTPTFLNLKDNVKVRCHSVNISIRKQGESVAPSDGLIVKNGDILEFAISPEFFDTNNELENVITWQWSQLKGDGTYTNWTNFGEHAKGVKFHHTTNTSGIFQVKCNFTNLDVQKYVRKVDAPHGTNAQGDYNSTVLSQGNPDFVGVVDEQWQILLRNQAKSHLGSNLYRRNVHIDVYPGGPKTSGSNKCNIFVYHTCNTVGLNVPLYHAYRTSLGYGPLILMPPLANQWADSSYALPKWIHLPNTSMPQPGMIVVRGSTSSSGHIGILNYDGSWINAGRDSVNQSIHLSTGYQPAFFRSYTP